MATLLKIIDIGAIHYSYGKRDMGSDKLNQWPLHWYNNTKHKQLDNKNLKNKTRKDSLNLLVFQSWQPVHLICVVALFCRSIQKHN